MRTIYKYPIRVEDEFLLDLPRGARLLHVERQRDQVCLWALVDPAAEKQRRKFIVRGTGHPIADGELEHVGTFMLDDGALVFHLFEALP